MNWFQRAIAAVLPGAEADTRRWTFDCPSCRQRSDFWEAGGVRYKAYGKPTVRLRCPRCSNRIWAKLVKDRAP